MGIGKGTLYSCGDRVFDHRLSEELSFDLRHAGRGPKRQDHGNRKPSRQPGNALAPFRIGVGIFPAVALATTGTVSVPAVIVGVIIGELIDRAEFYRELETDSPAREMAAALRAAR